MYDASSCHARCVLDMVSAKSGKVPEIPKSSFKSSLVLDSLLVPTFVRNQKMPYLIVLSHFQLFSNLHSFSSQNLQRLNLFKLPSIRMKRIVSSWHAISACIY